MSNQTAQKIIPDALGKPEVHTERQKWAQETKAHFNCPQRLAKIPLLPVMATLQHGSSSSRASTYWTTVGSCQVWLKIYTHFLSPFCLPHNNPKRISIFSFLECTAFSAHPAVMSQYPRIQLATSLEWWPTQTSNSGSRSGYYITEKNNSKAGIKHMQNSCLCWVILSKRKSNSLNTLISTYVPYT